MRLLLVPPGHCVQGHGGTLQVFMDLYSDSCSGPVLFLLFLSCTSWSKLCHTLMVEAVGVGHKA